MPSIETQILKNLQLIIGEYVPNFNPNSLSLFLDDAKIVNFRKGEIIAQQGEICQNLFFVHQGILRFYFLEEDKEVTSWFGFPNDMITIFDSFWVQRPSRESIQALSDCTLLSISFEKLNLLIQKNLDWERLARIFIIQYAIALEDRIHLLHQSTTAEEKYKNLINNHPKIIQFVSNKFIASYLGITRETLSRIRSNTS